MSRFHTVKELAELLESGGAAVVPPIGNKFQFSDGASHVYQICAKDYVQFGSSGGVFVLPLLGFIDAETGFIRTKGS